VAQSPVGTEIHEPFDVHGHFPAEVTLHDEARDANAKRLDLRFGEFTNLNHRVDSHCLTDLSRPRPADSVDRGEGDGGMLGRRYVDTRYSGHGVKLPVKWAIVTNRSCTGKTLTLPLFMPGFLADHPDHPSPFDDLAIPANTLD
jgi:hypothetical protein